MAGGVAAACATGAGAMMAGLIAGAVSGGAVGGSIRGDAIMAPEPGAATAGVLSGRAGGVLGKLAIGGVRGAGGLTAIGAARAG